MIQAVQQPQLFPETAKEDIDRDYDPAKNAVRLNGSLLMPAETIDGKFAELFFGDLVTRASKNEDLKLAYTRLEIKHKKDELRAEFSYTGETTYESRMIVFVARPDDKLNGYRSTWLTQDGAELPQVQSVKDLQNDRQAAKARSRKLVTAALEHIGLNA